MDKTNKRFNSYKDNCLITFFVLGNYFALFGLLFASKAEAEHIKGNDIIAAKYASKAKAWSYWGLIPSTIINVILIYYAIILIIHMLSPLLKALTTKY